MKQELRELRERDGEEDVETRNGVKRQGDQFREFVELVNIEPLDVEDADQLEVEIGAFLDAIRSGEAPA